MLNATPGRKWFDCADCHAETQDHALQQSFEMTFACKKCKKCFRKDAREFEERYSTITLIRGPLVRLHGAQRRILPKLRQPFRAGCGNTQSFPAG